MSRPFIDVLAELEAGRTVEDLTSALTELTSQVMAVRKGGYLDLKISVSPNGETSVELRAAIKVNAPEPARERTIMFADEFGGLRRENPRQHALPLREVNRPEPREVPETATLKQV
jgi:hypothetical protein